MRVPPGVSATDFSDVLKQFEEAVGREWVFTTDEDVDLYRDSYSPFWHETEEPIPSAAVAPGSVEQVQKSRESQMLTKLRCGPFRQEKTSATAAPPLYFRAASCSI